MPKVWRRSWKRSAPHAGRRLDLAVAPVQRRAVHRRAARALEDPVVGLRVALSRLQAPEQVEHLLGGGNRVHALALRQPVAADLGEPAPHDDRVLVPEDGPPAQPEHPAAAQAAQRGGQDRGGVVEILVAASRQLVVAERPLGHVNPPAGLRGPRVSALAGVVGAGGGRAHERPHLLDAVDLEVAGVA